ncbi:polyhomeotic-like protein 2 [Amphiura filiformis]|uniref:polyhomeotic-like protein 2 n=1 Tax=Amphiura filiformis TaxID=82378 RepID=UPI003B2104CE
MEKEVPRAIVRPQVLTHVIDGFIIEESREPFPVAHVPEPLPDVIPEQAPKPKQHKQQKPKQQVPRKDSGENSMVDDGNMLQCEFCGKMAPARSFTRSKRFCSKSCAKRYNVGCSKRLGLFSPKRDNSQKVKHSLKPPTKTKAKPPKGNVNRPQTAGPQKPFHIQHHQQQQQQQRQQQLQLQRTDSTTSSSSSNMQSGSEDSSRAASPSQVSEPDTTPGSEDDDAFEDAPSVGIPRDPATWSVLHVFEFIRTLPGCESYADEFRRQEIDGQALLLLKEDHLMTAMNMKLGPALKIINKINSLKNK